MARLVISNTVQALRTYRTMNELAKIGKGRKKAAERKLAGPTPPLDRDKRVRNYANQTGWTTDFTPAQRRRLEKKARHNATYARSYTMDEHAQAVTS